MSVGLIAIFLLAIIGILYVFRKSCGETQVLPLMIILILSLVSGLRYDVGVDCPVYREMYDDPSDIRLITLEPVWHWIIAGLRSMGFASRMWFILTSITINFLFYYGFKRLSVNIYLSLMLYVAMSFGYFESYNIVRQFVAGAILFATFHYVIERKIWKYMLCILLAACFHFSALIMIPFLFLMRIRYPLWLLWAIFIICFFMGQTLLNFALGQIIPYISEYSNYANNVSMEDYSGLLKLFYFLIGCGVLVVAPMVKRRFADSYLYINAVIMSLAWYFAFLDVQVLMRCMFYLTSFFFILIPMIVRCCTSQTKLILAPTIIMLFLIVTLKMRWSVPYEWDFKLFYPY